MVRDSRDRSRGVVLRVVLRILMGLAVATLIVLAVWGALTVSGEPEPRRSNLVVFTATMMIPLFLVWCAHVSGTEIASKLRTVRLPGQGLEVLVLRVALPDRKWVARRLGRLPAAARILIREDGLTVTWVDRTTSELRWGEAPQLSRRRVWAAYRRADAVRITSGVFFVEYVPFDALAPMSRAASEAHIQSIVDLTSGEAESSLSEGV